jgi:hypothetical protein
LSIGSAESSKRRDIDHITNITYTPIIVEINNYHMSELKRYRKPELTTREEINPVVQELIDNPELKEAPASTIQFGGEQRKDFLNFVEKFGILGLISNPNITEFAEKARGVTFTKEEEVILEKFKEIAALYNTKEKRFAYRYVSTLSSGMNINELVQSGYKNGGKNPQEKSEGSSVEKDHLGKVLKYLESFEESDKLLYVYDQSKLEDLTKEERDADINLKYYGMKPKEGLTFADALVFQIALTLDDEPIEDR